MPAREASVAPDEDVARRVVVPVLEAKGRVLREVDREGGRALDERLVRTRAQAALIAPINATKHNNKAPKSLTNLIKLLLEDEHNTPNPNITPDANINM